MTIYVISPLSNNFTSKSDASWDEENWKAQYGQVATLDDEGIPSFATVDLWDWEIVKEHTKKRHQIAKLIGRLVRRSSKLHPSVPAGGGVLKTAAIRAVHLDLVGVASGLSLSLYLSHTHTHLLTLFFTHILCLQCIHD